jgi:hypothetical protein
MGGRFRAQEWSLPDWASGIEILNQQRPQLADGDYRLVLFILSSEYDQRFLTELRDTIEKFEYFSKPTNYRKPLFSGVVFMPPPSDILRYRNSPSPYRDRGGAFPNYDPPEPLASVLGRMSHGAFQVDRTLTPENIKSRWLEFAGSMAHATYDLASTFQVPFDQLPCLLVLDPSDLSQFVLVSLRGAKLVDVYCGWRDEFTRWAHEHEGALAVLDSIWALRTRQWRHPSMARVERESVVPRISSALMKAAEDLSLDCAAIFQQFENCCIKVPLNLPRLGRLLHNNGSLTFVIDGSPVDEASLANVYDRLLQEAIPAELARFKESVEVPPFPLARLRHLGPIRQTAFVGASHAGPPTSLGSATRNPELTRIVEKAYNRTELSSFAGVSVFVSYSHRDEEFKDELDKHLAAAKRSGLVRVWHDRKIDAGASWRPAITDSLMTADIYVLLVSADFLASEFCWNQEFIPALARRQRGDAEIIPVIVRASDWRSSVLAELQVLPKDGVRLADCRSRDGAFVDVVNGIRKAAELILGRRQAGAWDSTIAS